jgi:FMN-dependent NADH-azoreductase
MSRIDAAHRRDVHRRSAEYVEEIIEERSVPISWPMISFRVNWRLQGWLLKNSKSQKPGTNLGIENV